MTLTVSQESIIDALNIYCFQNIWNEVGAEFRVNMKLQVYKERFTTGYIQGKQTIYLPTTDQYAIFIAPNVLFNGGLTIPTDQWVSSLDITNLHDIFLFIYTKDGKLLPKNSIFLYRTSRQNITYVIVKKNPLLKIVPKTDYMNLYLTLYKDSDLPNEFVCYSYGMPTVDTSLSSTAEINNRIAECKAINKAGTTVIVNGIEQSVDKQITFTTGDYVDIYLDNNVIAAYDVDLTEDITGFYSEKDACYKEVVHTPKAINPTNKMITHNTLTLYVRDNASNRGLYLHRGDVNSVEQLTHNDVCVSTRVINAHRDSLNSQNVSLHVKVRTHNKDNILMDEANFIKYLYMCTDEEIVQHMRGKIDSSLTFWTASHLEQSIYTTMMFDSPNFVTEEVLDDYIDGLGYLTVASLLSKHISNHTIPKADFGNIAVGKPIVLHGRETVPLVHINGRKIPHDKVAYTDHRGNTIYIGLDSSIYRKANDIVSVNLLPAGTSLPYIHTVSNITPYIDVEFSDCVVYEIVNLDYTVSGIGGLSSQISYRKIPERQGTLMIYPLDNGGSQVVCGQSLYGKTLMIQNKYYTRTYTIDLADKLTDTHILDFEMNTICKNDDRIVPLLGYNDLHLFLNSRYLTKDLDYIDTQITDSSGNIVFSQIIITNKEYLNTEGGTNIVEVVAHTTENLAEETGYVTDNIISNDTVINLWYDGITTIYANGDLLLNPINKGTTIEPGIPLDNGRPFNIKTSIPNITSEILSKYNYDRDLDRINKINTYFHRYFPVDPEFIIIPKSYTIYSPYITQIVYDINNGSFQPVNEPNQETFLKQFTDYGTLKVRDPSINNDLGIVNKDFVDCYPVYQEILLPSIAAYKIVHRLTDIVLGKEHETLGDIQNG